MACIEKGEGPVVSAFRPDTLQEALAILHEHRVIPFAGGTDLMVQRRRGSGLLPTFEYPVLFIGHLDELKEVRSGDGKVRIGSVCPYSFLLGDERVPWSFKRVLIQIASPAIRNRGTVGGNIVNASPAGDTLPYLYAFDAEALVQKWDAQRLIHVRDLVTGPGQTALTPGELLTAVIIPQVPFNRFFYKKVGSRKANSCSKLSFLGIALVEDGVVLDVRMCFGAVAPTVVRDRKIEEELVGKEVGKMGDMIPGIVRTYESLIKPIEDQRCTIRYRKEISFRLLEHFLGTVLVL